MYEWGIREWDNDKIRDAKKHRHKQQLSVRNEKTHKKFIRGK